MKMYKKLIGICIGSTLLLGLTACDSSKQSESSEKANVKSQPETKKDLTSQDELNKKIEENVLWENSLLPIKLVYEKQKEIEIIDQVLTEEEVIDKAIDEARIKMEDDLEEKEYIISQKNLKINIKESKIVLEVFFVVYEDITDYQEIVEIPQIETE